VVKVILDGEPFLDLPGMLKYANRSNNINSSQSSDKKGGVSLDGCTAGMSHLDLQGSPAKGALDRLGIGRENTELKKVVVHMTQRDPDKRLSVAEYRHQLEKGTGTDTPFPSFFSNALYPLFLRLHWEGIGPDQRIAILCEVQYTLFSPLLPSSLHIYTPCM
jgi:hypothetical protein